MTDNWQLLKVNNICCLFSDTNCSVALTPAKGNNFSCHVERFSVGFVRGYLEGSFATNKNHFCNIGTSSLSYLCDETWSSLVEELKTHIGQSVCSKNIDSSFRAISKFV